jgi:hypothetical protein
MSRMGSPSHVTVPNTVPEEVVGAVGEVLAEMSDIRITASVQIAVMQMSM